MTNEYFDCEVAKERFALLVSKLHGAGLPDDYISKVLVESPFFDCFESNDLSSFLGESLESISARVFRKEAIYDYSSVPADPYYWAGLVVMGIMMNGRIPLKRVLLTMDLSEIVSCFAPFHEMSDERFLEYFLSLEKERSLLKRIREEKGLSLRKIAFLAGIKMPTLVRIDSSSEALFGTSFASLSALASLFALSGDVFKRTSSYIPFSFDLLKNGKMEEKLGKNICLYFSIPLEKGFSISHYYLNDKEAKGLLGEKGAIVDLSNPFGILYLSSNRLKRKFLSKEEFLFLYVKSSSELQKETGGLLF